ncbi:DNA polymerase III subunit beta [Xanthobacter oligotrophicus]|uniref:Beta sliding clamp n=1 Tax=Xanthobacter oligotrophicus TaxID=2607286 RepID=A0ABW6ZSD4_9HYPH
MAGITVEAGALMRALSRTLAAVDRRPTVPILATVYLVSSGCQLTIAGANLEMEIRAQLPAVGELPATCVNPRVLRDLLKGLPASECVTLETGESGATLRVQIGEEDWSLRTLPVEDWPAFFAELEGQLAEVRLDAGWIGDVLARVAPFMSTEDTRYYLNGVLLEAEGDKLLAVATNGAQLGRVERTVPEAATAISAAGFVGLKSSCIIPSDMVRAVLAHIRGPVTVALSSAPLVCRVEGDGLTITGKLIDGVYPDYRRILEEPKDIGYEIDRLSLLSALARLKAISSRGGDPIVSICWRKGRLFLERRDAEIGMASIPVPGTTLGTWPNIPLHFDRARLAMAVQQIRGSAFRLQGGNSPYSQAQLIDVSDPASTFILMPMRGETALPHEPPVPPAEPEVRAAE